MFNKISTWFKHLVFLCSKYREYPYFIQRKFLNLYKEKPEYIKAFSTTLDDFIYTNDPYSALGFERTKDAMGYLKFHRFQSDGYIVCKFVWWTAKPQIVDFYSRDFGYYISIKGGYVWGFMGGGVVSTEFLLTAKAFKTPEDAEQWIDTYASDQQTLKQNIIKISN